jgi:hypothetical protein
MDNKIIRKNDPLNDIIRENYHDEKLHTLYYKGIVIDQDNSIMSGGLKIRILGLHNYIRSDNNLPIAFPFFGIGGLVTTVPKRGEWVWLTFEYLEPVGQLYWMSLIAGKKMLDGTQLNELYRQLFGD